MEVSPYRRIHGFRELRPGRMVKVRWPLTMEHFGYRNGTVDRTEKRGCWVVLDSGGRVRFSRCADVLLLRVRRRTP